MKYAFRRIAAWTLHVVLLHWSVHGYAAAPPVLLAKTFTSDIDPGLYWVSEKLDGVRALWDGERLYFRSGRQVPAPAWFTEGFPKQPLDGELWMGRGTFERLSGVVRKGTPVDEDWLQVKYMLFELPEGAGDFTRRKDRLGQLAAEAGVPWLQRVEQFRVPDRKALQTKLREVTKAGGEGLMLHRADALFVSGRSDVLLKLKPYLDADAKVVAHLPGKGRFAGKLGALAVEDSEGRRFRIGTGFSDADRERPPELGSTVSYRYQGLTSKGLPRFPVYLRKRETF